LGRTIITDDGRFEWDEDKNFINRARHGIDFNFAQDPQIDFWDGWYRSTERYKHSHPKKYKVECSLDEDVIEWLRSKTDNDDDYSIYINHFLKAMMNKE
jgi:hypothetical protein